MFTQALIYAFFFAAGVLALFAVFRVASERSGSDVQRFHRLLVDLALALALVGIGQILRLLLAILSAG